VLDPRAAVEELTELLADHLGDRLLGLYLFGSLAAGGFHPGKSDLDLFAVLEAEVAGLEPLQALHAGFADDHPEWTERVEVGYVSRAVLQTLGDDPRGRIAVISPGEPLNVKEVEYDWTLNWHAVCTRGETLLGPSPLELGPPVTSAAYLRAIENLLAYWKTAVRAPSVAYVPAQQGYIVVTLCRALHGLATGKQTTKADAAAWAADQFPEWAPFIEEALATHRADVSEQHERTIRFVDYAVNEANRAR
jgi:Aminoglycoside adenylyltransferase, C-terminal domain/Nucleotidyltransferase domain